MSFFAKLGSSGSESSDSGSDSEESILSGDEGQEQDAKLAQKKNKGGYNARMFEKGGSDEDESEESDEDEMSEGSAADRQVRKEGGKGDFSAHSMSDRSWPTGS